MPTEDIDSTYYQIATELGAEFGVDEDMRAGTASVVWTASLSLSPSHNVVVTWMLGDGSFIDRLIHGYAETLCGMESVDSE